MDCSQWTKGVARAHLLELRRPRHDSSHNPEKGRWIYCDGSIPSVHVDRRADGAGGGGRNGRCDVQVCEEESGQGDEYSIQNDDCCIQNDELCIQNDEF